jgi:hypothetical protein
MSFAASIRNRNSERVIALVSALAVLLSMMVIFATPALAHHPTTTANQTCVDGEVMISYTSTSWQLGEPGHPDVRIEVSVNGGTWTEVASGAYTAGNGYSFSGTFSGDAYWDQSIRVRSQVNGAWPNGADAGNTHPDATTAAFTVSQDCFNPSCPSGLNEFKIEPVASGTYGPNDEFTITVNDTASGETFDWTSTLPVFQVIAKGGPGANVYDYVGAFSGTGLHAPDNPNSGQYYGLSHITLCSGEVQDVDTTFSITGVCEVIQGVPSFAITGNLGEGLALTVAGQTVDASGPFSLDAGAAGDYDYEVTLDDGYVLADGSPSPTGTVTLEDCTPPPSGWACVEGEAVFIEDATDFEGTLYETEAEAWDDPGCQEVLAATTFTIGATCALGEAGPSFAISGNLGEGLTLTVAGETVDSSGAFSIAVGGAGSFAYSVSLDDGFVLAEGSPPAAGSVVVEDCTVPPPPSGWVCEAGEAVFLPDTTGFVGTVYESQAEALEDPECQSVLAATTFTIGGVCTLVGDVASFRISGSLGEGLTLTVAGQTVTTSPFSVAVGSAGSYPYSVTLDEGFELAVGSPAAAGTILIQDCSSDTEIDEVDELPFTGIDAGALAVASMALLGTGAMMLMSSGRREES